jgi:hypothetical protein
LFLNLIAKLKNRNQKQKWYWTTPKNLWKKEYEYEVVVAYQHHNLTINLDEININHALGNWNRDKTGNSKKSTFYNKNEW